MADNIKSYNHNNTLINQRYKDGYINLTAMAQANGKLIADYLRLDTTNAFLSELSETMGIPIVKLVEVKTGRGGGTWGHPQVAINCGQWCSPPFAVQVTQWVLTWMTTGQNPLQSDLDRMVYRDALKDEVRLQVTDQVKQYLQTIKRYDDVKYRGLYFARFHDRINIIITSETSKQMKTRLSELLGREVKDHELIRDYFPALTLNHYISLCRTTANLIIEGMNPLEALERAKTLSLSRDYVPQRIEFVESIRFVRERTITGQKPLELSEGE